MGGGSLLFVPQENTGAGLRRGPVRGRCGCGTLGPGGPARPPAPKSCPLRAGRTMGTHKPLILPWLVSQLDQGRLEGVAWLDKGRTRFRIPWKHGLRQDAQQKDFGIFQVRARGDTGSRERPPEAGGLRGGGPARDRQRRWAGLGREGRGSEGRWTGAVRFPEQNRESAVRTRGKRIPGVRGSPGAGLWVVECRGAGLGTFEATPGPEAEVPYRQIRRRQQW